MLICDNAIREEGTGKVSLIGIFEQVRSDTFPFGLFSLAVYVKVTDAQGDYNLPRWTPENRPVVDGAKPASGRAPQARVFYSGGS